MNLKLGHKISLLFIAVSIGILAIISAYLTANLKKETLEHISVDHQMQLEHIDFAVTYFFKDIESDLQSLAANRLVSSRDDHDFTSFLNADEKTFQYNYGELEKNIIKILNDYRQNHEYVNSVYMGRSNGGFVRSQKRTRPTQYDPRVRPWYTLGWNNPGKVMRTKPYTSVATPDVNIGIVTALLDEQRRPYGVLGINVTLARLTKYIENISIHENWYAVIIDETGEILASSDKGMRFMAIDTLCRDDLEPLFNNLSGYMDIELTFRSRTPEKNFLFFYTSPYLKWKLAFIVPAKEIYAQVNRLVVSTILLLTITLFLLSVLTLIGLRRYIIKPIKQLDNVAGLITRTGDLDQKIENQTGDEIGSLAKSFKLMMSSISKTELSLRNSEKQLKEHRDHLEELIKERTADLRKLSQAVEHSPMQVMITNRDGDIEYVNPRFSAVTGYSSEEVVGKNPHILSSGEVSPAVYDELWNTIISGKVWTGELINRRKDGHKIWERSSIAPILDKDENIKHYVAVKEDVTDAKKVQNERDEAFEVITSSIQYASRIQRSLLPPLTNFEKTFSDYFIIWEPRDSVGGDIYFHKPWGLGKLVALVDCTGHGVPGAFMSFMANGALDQAILETPPGDSAILLQRCHQLVQTSLGQRKKKGESDDGMEIGLCYIAPRNKKMVFAGARFSLFMVENGQVCEIKGDKKNGLGYRGTPYNAVFTNHDVKIDARCTYYMTSDGLIDQIGGPKRRSFGKKRLKNQLLEMESIPWNQRGESLLQALAQYQGAERRRDDVSVIGFSVFMAGH